MIDKFGREIDYLRISVTDLCNLRCTYCMPKDGVAKFSHESIISPERIKEIVEEAAKLGIKKVRLTGGEPLVRHGILDICKFISNVKGIEALCLTTNGVLLKDMAEDLKDAGVTRLNVSLDTLNPEKYHRITRVGNLQDVLDGIKAAKAVGLGLKINAVLIGGFNDDEIEDFKNYAKENELTVRFIELMPIGESKDFDKEAFIDNNIVVSKLENDLIFDKFDGVSLLYKIKDSKGSIGLISPLSHSFCQYCSRLRLTSDGKLRPCLHSSLEVSTNNLHGEDLKNAIQKAILLKPKQHHLNSGSEAELNMNEIGG